MAARDRGPEVLAVAGLMLALSMIFTLLRLYARAVIVRQIGSDDYLAFAAQLCFTMLCICSFVDVHYGMGKRGVDIPNLLSGGAVNAVLWWWIAELWYLLAGLLLKLSMGIFLLRIATARPHRYTIYVILFLTVASTAYFFFQFIFQCWPVSYFWTRIDIMNVKEGDGSCRSEELILKSAYAYSAITCAVDFALCLLPLVMVAKLQLNRRIKFSVMGVLSLWLLASITTFIRLPYLSGLKGDQINFLYNTADLGIWSIAETGISIMCIATATLRPLFAKSFFRSSNASRTATGTGNWGGGSRGTPGGMGSPRGAGMAGGSGKGSRTRTIDEEIGVAMGSDDDLTTSSIELQNKSGVGIAVSEVHDGHHHNSPRGHGGHAHSRSYNEPRDLGLGTRTYVSGGRREEGRGLGEKSESENEAQEGTREADFVYGYGIRRTTVVTTERE